MFEPLVEAISHLVRELHHDREQRKHEFEWIKSHAGLATKHDLEMMEKRIMANQTELAQQLRDLKTQIEKVAKEQSDKSDTLSQKITDLEAVIAAGGEVSPEVTDALAAVKSAVQALDDTIPDAPAPTP